MIKFENIFKTHCFECNCGMKHILPITEIIVNDGAIKNLEDINYRLKLGKKGIVVTDDLIYRSLGLRILDIFKKGKYDIKFSLFSSNTIIANEKAIVKILNDLDVDIDFLVAVGGGTINDLVRFISFKVNKPYISVPTVPSMDGYAASVSLLVINNFKRTYQATYPLAIYADTEILSKAPDIFIAAGFGDLIAKITARADWLISNIINGEYYCDFTATVIHQFVKRVIENTKKIKNKEFEGIKLLTEGLMVSGIAMHWVNSSRPVAGAEHHISHFWEMRAIQKGQPSHLHGIKVGLGTLIMCKIYEKLFSRNWRSINLKKLSKQKYVKEDWELKMKKVYGTAAEEVIIENKERFFSKEEFITLRNAIIQNYEKLETSLKSFMPTSRDVMSWLSEVGALVSPKEIGLTKELLQESILYCKELRKKFTILEVADHLGLLKEIAEEISDEMFN